MRYIIKKMPLIEIKIEVVENDFNRRILRLIYNLSVFRSLILNLWKNRKKKKRPKILSVRLIRFWFHWSLFIFVTLPSSLFLFVQPGKLNTAGEILLVLVFASFAFALLFTLIFAIVYLLNILYRLAACLFEAIVITIWCFKHPIRE